MHRLVVSRFQIFIFLKMGEGHYLYHMGEMIKDNQMTAGNENGFRMHAVCQRNMGKLFPLSDQIIIKESHKPALKGRQILDRHRFEFCA